MLLGLYGPHAIGKTTAARQLMTRWAGDTRYSHIRVISPDVCTVYWMERGVWKSEHQSKEVWKGKSAAKLPFIMDMVGDDSTLYLVESARYFSGMFEYLVEAHRLAGGGSRYYVVVTQGDILGRQIAARCKEIGKTFRDDYWTPEKLQYEAWGRYESPTEKYLRPAGIHYSISCIDEERRQWPLLKELISRDVLRPVDWWYKS